jgi:hypothetical protein
MVILGINVFKQTVGVDEAAETVLVLTVTVVKSNWSSAFPS